MKQASLIATLLTLLILGLSSACARQQVVFAPGQFRAHVEDNRTETHHAGEVLPLFDAMMISALSGNRGVRGLSDEDLVSLADDAAVANFYFPGARVSDHRMLFHELVRRHIASELIVDDYFRTLVAARSWGEATALAARFPDFSLERLPSHIREGDVGNGAHYLDYDSTQDSLTRNRLNVSEGISLVVISHPNCGFSRAAMVEIESNRSLHEALPSHRIFVAPTFGGLRLDSIWRWNESHPTTRHVLVDSPSSWRFVSHWNTPQFLFLVDGEVVATLEGWPDRSQTALLIAAAQKASLIAENKHDQEGSRGEHRN